MDIISETLKTYELLSSLLDGEDLKRFNHTVTGLLGPARGTLNYNIMSEEFLTFKENPRSYLENMNEDKLYEFHNSLERLKGPILAKHGVRGNDVDYKKEFPKFFQILNKEHSEKLNIPYFTHTDLRPILSVAEEMPEYFQRYIIGDLVYGNISDAHFLTSLALEFPILRNPICEHLISFGYSHADTKKRIRLAELILRDFGNRLNEKASYAWGLLKDNRVTEDNYKEFFTYLLNPSNCPNAVVSSFFGHYDKSNYLSPRFLNFPNAEKFCNSFNNAFKGALHVPIMTFHKFVDFLIPHWGKDVNFAPKLAEFFSFNKYFQTVYDFDFVFIAELIISGEIPCSNLEQLSSLFRGFILINRKLHNLYGDLHKAQSNMGFDVLKHIIITFLNNKYDPSNDLLSKAIDLVLNESLLTETDMPSRCLELGINVTDLRHQLNDLKQQFMLHRLQLNKSKIYDLDNKINLIESYTGIIEYKSYKKNKVPELYLLNYIVNEDLKFEVLSENSFEYFTVGSATECCQRLKREGVAACVDSYINPLAGVLVLKARSERKWIIIAQSYFHYVPEDNGYILDNVETNEWAVKNFKINLDSLYASLGVKLKEAGISYFRCGSQFNKLDSSSFSQQRIEKDNRHFEAEKLGLELDNGYEKTTERYTDYKGKFLDLYLPVKNLPLVELYKLEKTSALSMKFYLMTLKLGIV